jgi:hypothetical protein
VPPALPPRGLNRPEWNRPRPTCISFTANAGDNTLANNTLAKVSELSHIGPMRTIVNHALHPNPTTTEIPVVGVANSVGGSTGAMCNGEVSKGLA